MISSLRPIRLISLGRTCSTSGVTTSQDPIWHTKGDSKSNVTVLVCGWAASRQIHVEKYTNLFAQDFRLNTFGCILDSKSLFGFDHKAQATLATRVLETIGSETSNETNLIIMSLSNNGAAVYQHLVHLCTSQKQFSEKFKIKGAIFDSAPGPLSWPAYMVCGLNLGSNKILQRILTPTVSNDRRLFRPLAPWLLHFYIDRMEAGKKFPESLKEAREVAKHYKKNWNDYALSWPWPGDYILKEEATWPLLFLYSDDDTMMPSAFIERVIAAQKSKRSVISHNFPSSPHVAHLRFNPQVYKEKTLQFLRQIDKDIS